MNFIFKSSHKLLKKLKPSHLLIIIVIIIIVSMSNLLVPFVLTTNAFRDLTKKEILGIAYIQPLISIMEAVQDYRHAEGQSLSGDKNQGDRLSVLSHDIDKKIEVMDSANDKMEPVFQSTPAWTDIRHVWTLIKERRVLDSTQSTHDDASMLISNIHKLVNKTCDNSHIILEPDLIPYYLGDTYCNQLPGFVEHLALARDITDQVLSAKKLSAANRKQLRINITLMNGLYAPAIKRKLDKVSTSLVSHGAVVPKFLSRSNQLISDTLILHNLIEENIISGKLIPSISFSKQSAVLLDLAYSLDYKVGVTLNDALQERVKELTDKLHTKLFISVFGILLLLFLFEELYSSITNDNKKFALMATQVRDMLKQNHVNNMKPLFEEMITTVTQAISTSNQAVTLIQAVDIDAHFIMKMSIKLQKEIVVILSNSQRLISHDMAALDDIIVQSKLLALNVATQASKLGENSDPFLALATNIHNIAKTLSEIMQAIITSQESKVMHGTQAVQMINVLDERSATLIASTNQLVALMNEILPLLTQQQVSVDNINAIQCERQTVT